MGVIQQRSKEWFAARKGRVTGSIAGAVLGLNPWMSPDDVMRKMVREYHGESPEFTGNVATAYGQFHEKGAIDELYLEHSAEFQECGFYTFENWLGASPDGINDEAVLEVKCPYGQREKNPPEFKTAEQQMHYYAQMQIEMFCAERYQCTFYQWAPFGAQIEYVFRDQEWLDENMPKLKAFWVEYLKEREMPYAERHLHDKRKMLEAPKLIAEYDELTEAIEHATARRKEVLDLLVKEAGERDAEICGRKLTQVKRKGSVSYKKIIDEKLPGFDVEPYRGKETSFWKLS